MTDTEFEVLAVQIDDFVEAVLMEYDIPLLSLSGVIMGRLAALTEEIGETLEFRDLMKVASIMPTRSENMSKSLH